MKEKRNLHLKVQELCDCYGSTDYLREMSVVQNDADREEAALKWLALVALHGVNGNAKKVTLSRTDDGKVKVVAEYRETELPSPGAEVASKIFSSMREITHIEDEKGKTVLALGIRDSSIETQIKLKSKHGKEELSVEFPD